MTDERLQHVLEHPEMTSEEERIRETLATPDTVTQSRSDPEISLYDRFYDTSRAGPKHLCTVVKWHEDDAFLVNRVLHGSAETRDGAMAEQIRVWYDPESDFLEVTFDERAGSFKETALDQVMAKVDDEGHVIGFSILNVASLKGRPLDLSLAAAS
ncbi:MAG: DUF2283 domain-containing protein [Dehalococcoidia bacterium]